MAVRERVIYGDDENARRGYEDLARKVLSELMDERQADVDGAPPRCVNLEPIAFECVGEDGG